MSTQKHPTEPVAGAHLAAGMALLGEEGGRSLIYEVGPSSAMPGLVRVETEHGPLYLDPEHDYDVLSS